MILAREGMYRLYLNFVGFKYVLFSSIVGSSEICRCGGQCRCRCRYRQIESETREGKVGERWRCGEPSGVGFGTLGAGFSLSQAKRQVAGDARAYLIRGN